MSEFFAEYGMFLAKTLTVVLALLVSFGVIVALSARNRMVHRKGEVAVTRLNDTLADMEDMLKYNVLSKDELKTAEKEQKKADKQARKSKDKTPVEPRKRVYVLDFKSDVKAEEVESLRTEITAILTIATPADEVVLRLESPGGQVHMYGLAASQLERLKARSIPLTVCVDKVAASGGYMMACVASKIIAAPFAVVGSIGVVAELPNFNRVLKRFDVDYNVYTAGEFKRTVTLMGENTEEGVRKFREELEDTQRLFKALVQGHRPQLDIDSVATGEHWYGSQALERKLVDSLGTSDDYLFDLSKQADLFEVRYEIRRSMAERLGFHVESLLRRSIQTAQREITRTPQL